MILHRPDLLAEAPSCVLIDLDHTLYDYGSCNAAGMEAASLLAQALLNLPVAEFKRCFADARSELKARLGHQAAAHSRLLYFQRTVERAGFASQPFIVLQLEQAFWRAYLDKATLFENAHEFLDDLRIAGIPCVVVTDMLAQIQMRKLIVLGLDRVIDWIVTSEETGADKPAAVNFELALAKLGGVEGPVWMIGDNHHCDMTGAKRSVGAITLHKTHPGDAPPPNREDIDASFEHFADLRRLLAKTLKRA